MTSNFSQTTISKSARRDYTEPIGTLTDFTAVVAAFLADTTMNLVSKEKKSESYKVPVKFFAADGDMKGSISITVENTTAYDDAMSMLASDQDLSNCIAGAGSDSTEDETEALWNARISCKLGTDTFTVNFNRDYAVVSGYSDDATLAIIEAWFDNNTTVA